MYQRGCIDLWGGLEIHNCYGLVGHQWVALVFKGQWFSNNLCLINCPLYAIFKIVVWLTRSIYLNINNIHDITFFNIMQNKCFWIVMFMCMKMSSVWFHFPKPSVAMKLDIEDSVIFFKVTKIGTQLMNGERWKGREALLMLVLVKQELCFLMLMHPQVTQFALAMIPNYLLLLLLFSISIFIYA